jgi:hypothetical protein
VGAWCSSTSGRTRASTGCGRCDTSGRGTRGIVIAGSSSSECTRRSSGLSTTLMTSNTRRSTGRRRLGRSRQRLHDLAVVGEPLLAGRLPRRSRRSSPLPAFGRGRLRGDRASDPAATERRRGDRPSRRQRASPSRRLGHPGVPGNLVGDSDWSGGVSLGLVAWRLSIDEQRVAEAWSEQKRRACSLSAAVTQCVT